MQRAGFLLVFGTHDEPNVPILCTYTGIPANTHTRTRALKHQPTCSCVYCTYVVSAFMFWELHSLSMGPACPPPGGAFWLWNLERDTEPPTHPQSRPRAAPKPGVDPTPSPGPPPCPHPTAQLIAVSEDEKELLRLLEFNWQALSSGGPDTLELQARITEGDAGAIRVLEGMNKIVAKLMELGSTRCVPNQGQS